MLKPPSNRGKARMSLVVSSFLQCQKKLYTSCSISVIAQGGEVYDCSSIAEGGC